MTEVKITNDLVNNPMIGTDISEMKTEDLVRMMVVTVNSTAQTVNQIAREAQRQAITLSKHEGIGAIEEEDSISIFSKDE